MKLPIETERLTLVVAHPEILRTAIQGNAALGQCLHVQVAENWSEFGEAPLAFALDQQAGSGAEVGWWTYFPVHKQEKCMIGSGGYAGKPNEEGSVEIGYEIAPAWRGQGYATEFAMGLIQDAFKYPEVKRIIAHTLGTENASTAVLKKCGFKKTKDLEDPDEGTVWEWELERD